MLLKPVLFLFSKSAASGAQTQIKLALDPELENVTGKYFVDCKETEPAQNAKDDELAAWLWNKSAEMAGIDDKLNNA
jgi:retinol dehydrogenase 13